MTSSSRAEICEPVSSRGGIAVSTTLLVAVEWRHHIAVELHSQWSHPIYRGMRGMILDGTFASGARLPATRALADDLGVSRNIALLPYRRCCTRATPADGSARGRTSRRRYR